MLLVVGKAVIPVLRQQTFCCRTWVFQHKSLAEERCFCVYEGAPVPRGPQGGGVHSMVACLSSLTIDHECMHKYLFREGAQPLLHTIRLTASPPTLERNEGEAGGVLPRRFTALDATTPTPWNQFKKHDCHYYLLPSGSNECLSVLLLYYRKHGDRFDFISSSSIGVGMVEEWNYGTTCLRELSQSY